MLQTKPDPSCISSFCRLLIFALASLVLAACDDFPRDPNRTLEQVLEAGTLEVGVFSRSPWIKGPSRGSPSGVEAQLLESFARELGVNIAWHWASPEEHFSALQQYELDVVAGGLTKASPWRKHVAFTMPYYASYAVVGTPPDYPPISSLEDITVATTQGSGLAGPLRGKDANVVFTENLSASEFPVAAPEWRIEAIGFDHSGIILKEIRHVMAAPPGENALVTRLERFLQKEVGRERVREILRMEAEQ